ncbi:cobalt-precorrin-6A reductase [Arenibaculum pallidiluteum]|uniref:cobalt-precorrin-6A reductase n=1 Tax=Arenibaculum pallidiluteum TaxID=2812559 RepID=UPI001A95A239|nr:cobalt-precorrin-6A reductase [Arenibaculum pallidiluteum]
MPRLLILGGTAEAVALAHAAVALPGWQVVSSLAGRTRAPAPLPGTVRTGGFGGAEGLAHYLDEAGIDVLVDATHPFAARISANAETACRLRPTPRLALVRPAWTQGPGDRWTELPDMPELAAAIPAGARVFLAVGRQELGPFAGRDDAWFLIRTIDRPPSLPLRHHAVVTGRGPFDEAAEAALLREHGIDVIAAKNSGGEGGRAKLVAARRLGIPVLLLRRPDPPAAPVVASVSAVLAWLSGWVRSA